MQNTNEIDELVKLISKLPGLGPKSAKRIVLKLINNRDELVKPLAKSLAEVYKKITRCNICGTLKSNLIECNFDNCKIVEKKYNKICVVENISDQWSIESSNIFIGYFHILGGTISSVGQKKEDLLITSPGKMQTFQIKKIVSKNYLADVIKFIHKNNCFFKVELNNNYYDHETIRRLINFFNEKNSSFLNFKNFIEY